MVPTRRRPSAQGIKCPTVHSGHIPATNHRYGGCVEWPPRSTDLNPLEFFLWGYIKQRVHVSPPTTLQELRNSITGSCACVSPAMLYNVQREVQSRVQMCIVAEGHHFEHDRYMSLISGKCSFVQRDQTNVRFVLFISIIFVLKMFLCNKSMMLNNFVIDFFSRISYRF
ncbi:hypothetical protein AVEN_52881-1 [Araneus ventricosus]|uniref:Tc1-like transposase DDE domain-containing protein n=1 Tax=Araneus ventricosus TaxID=182803 RepID=A0A4Y1ZV51_ARAVE|nr:hypothetical protein AVEN_52881-1 [Araneus ventricosus]